MRTVLYRPLSLASLPFVGVVLLLGPAEAMGQVVAASFAELQTLVKPGDTIEVTDTKRRKTTGRLGDLSASSLELLVRRTDQNGERTVPQKVAEADVTGIRVARRDSLWNGMAIGLGVGAGLGLGFAQLACQLENETGDGCTEGTRVSAFVMVAGLGAAIGLGIDAAKRKKIDVYQRAPTRPVTGLSVVPVVSPSAAGIRMSLRF